MGMLSIRKQEKVLKKLIKLCFSNKEFCIYRPKDFEANFSFLRDFELYPILKILEDSELIAVQYADLPDNFNINSLIVTPKGLNYNPLKRYRNKLRWLDRLWGFISGVFVGAGAGALLQYTIRFLEAVGMLPK